MNVFELSVSPFLKWAGGKRQLLPEIHPRIPIIRGRYIEPFMGAAAVFFFVAPQKSLLNDINQELVNCFCVVRDEIDELLERLSNYYYDKNFYYKIRELDRQDGGLKNLDPIERAARFIYLNRTGFNGLYRVNSKGHFNVPFGKYKNPKIADNPKLKACHHIMQGSKITRFHFREVLSQVKQDDFVYLDPPYQPISSTSKFTNYDKIGFGNDEILDQVTVILEVNSLQGIRIWSIDDKFSEFASPGETVFFDVRVVNYESQEQDVDLSYNSDDLSGWSVVFNNQSSWSKTLPSGSSTSVSIGVTPPSSESVDTVDLEIKGTTPGFLPVYFYSNITVNQEFGVSVGSKSVTTLLGNVSELVKIFVTNTGNGPDVFDVTYTGEWVENNTVSYAFEGFEVREISIPVNSGLVATGSQSSVEIIVNSTKSKLAGNELSDSSTLDFVVTGIKPVSSQSISLQRGQTASFDLAILSLNTLGDPTSRVITEVAGDVYWWASFDNTEEFEGEQTLICLLYTSPSPRDATLSRMPSSA